MYAYIYIFLLQSYCCFDPVKLLQVKKCFYDYLLSVRKVGDV